MKRGFTLLELLVASMLLAMLVTILTMIFNQSSVAWSTGTASVAGLGSVREKMAIYSGVAEDVIVTDNGSRLARITSIWNQDPKSKGFRTEGRTVSVSDNDLQRLPISASDIRDPMQSKRLTVGAGDSAGRDTYIVGVVSYGPDGQTGGSGSWDDISTLPEEVVK